MIYTYFSLVPYLNDPVHKESFGRRIYHSTFVIVITMLNVWTGALILWWHVELSNSTNWLYLFYMLAIKKHKDWINNYTYEYIFLIVFRIWFPPKMRLSKKVNTKECDHTKDCSNRLNLCNIEYTFILIFT